MNTLTDTHCYMRIAILKKKINLVCKYYGNETFDITLNCNNKNPAKGLNSIHRNKNKNVS